MSAMKSSADYYARVASVEADLAGIGRALLAVEEKRKEAGLRFAEGEAVDFSEIDAEEVRLAALRKNLLAAQDQAKLLHGRARDAEKAKREREKIFERNELRAQVLEVSSKFDEAARAMVAALEERSLLVAQFAPLQQETSERLTGGLNDNLYNALAAAGFGKFFHHVASRTGERLAEIDARGIGFSAMEHAVLEKEAARNRGESA